MTSTVPLPCSPPMTGVPGVGWHVEHASPAACSGDGSTCAAWAPRDVAGEEAPIARRVVLCPGAVARRAREDAARLVVATRAGGRARRRRGHARRARRRPLVAPTACARVAGIEHRRPACRAQHGAVERWRARVDDAGIVNVTPECGRPTRDPGRDGGSLRVIQEPAVRIRVQGSQDRSAAVGRERRRRAPDARVTHAIAPRNDVALHPPDGFVSPWHATQRARRTGAMSAS